VSITDRIWQPVPVDRSFCKQVQVVTTQGSAANKLKRIAFRFSFSLLLTVVLLECALALLSHFLDLPFSAPKYRRPQQWKPFWSETMLEFGMWHQPNSNGAIKKGCFNVEYHSNSYGAVDVERERNSSHPRIVVLGDSFIEGYGVPQDTRLTTILERQSGIEHLNFGTSGVFGPTQYYLLYKALAAQFDHSAILVGILPDNDFLEDDITYGRSAYYDMYRPYFVEADSGYKLTYFREHFPAGEIPTVRRVERFLREYSYAANAAYWLWRVKAHQLRPDGYSGYYDYSAAQLSRLRHVLTLLREAAPQKDLIVFTIPRKGDFLRAQDSPPPLRNELRKMSEQLHFQYIDLLPHMQSTSDPVDALYLPCDGHWNEKGHQRAADILMRSVNLYKRGATPQR
jgi:hypothetical protein